MKEPQCKKKYIMNLLITKSCSIDLLKAYSLWLPEENHKTLASLWPPVGNNFELLLCRSIALLLLFKFCNDHDPTGTFTVTVLRLGCAKLNYQGAIYTLSRKNYTLSRKKVRKIIHGGLGVATWGHNFYTDTYIVEIKTRYLTAGIFDSCL